MKLTFANQSVLVEIIFSTLATVSVLVNSDLAKNPSIYINSFKISICKAKPKHQLQLDWVIFNFDFPYLAKSEQNLYVNKTVFNYSLTNLPPQNPKSNQE